MDQRSAACLHFHLDWLDYLQVPCRSSQHEQPAAFLRRVRTGSGCAVWGWRWGAAFGGLAEEDGVCVEPPQQFHFSETLQLAFVLHFSFLPLSCSLGSFIITPYIYQSFSAVPANLPALCPVPPSLPSLQPPQWKTSTCVMDLLETWWEAGACDVRWADCVFTCCLTRLGELCRGVWRQSGHVCEVSVWMETEAPCFPPTHTLHILTKEKPCTGSDSARHLWGWPVLHSFHSSLSLHSLLSLSDSLFPLPLSLSVWRRIA